MIAPSAFSLCTSLEKVTLPEGLLYIDSLAFSQTGLTSITLPKSLEYLGFIAFTCCDNLAEINIPDDAAFLVKNATEVAVFLSEEKGWDDEAIARSGEEIFSGSKINESVALQKKLREIKCIDAEALTYYPKAKEKYSRWY